MSGILIRGARLVDARTDARGSLLAEDGRIVAVLAGADGEASILSLARDPASVETVDARGAVLMPSFIDLHAHFRDPGFTHKEDLESGSRAAAAGGFGTLVLMANTDPVCSDQAAAERNRARVAEIGLVDAFQAVSLTRGFDGRDTSALAELDPAVVPVASEDGREVASARVMLEAMERCAQAGVLVSCHCEDPELALAAKPHREAALRALALRGDNRFGDLAGSADFEPVRASLDAAERLLRLAENTMTERNLALAAAAACPTHVAHVSTREAVEAIRRTRARLPGLVTCEATPHHLALTSFVPAIVNPPLRSEDDRQALIAGLLDGTIDAIATDHAPHTAEDKAAGAPGFSGLETAFAVCHSVLVKTGRMDLRRLSALMSENPARILGLARGALSPGLDADFVLVDPEAEWTVEPMDGKRWLSRGRNTPFAGEKLTGLVLATYKRGRLVYSRPLS